jgi:UDP-N-acetylmuramoyl-L-alanyl-D-glutamate--2,6-diaminopimelate ligase
MVSLDQLLQDVSYSHIQGNMNIVVTGVTSDSRRVRKNFAYVAVHGVSFDGETFINDALVRGANLIVSEKDEKILDACTVLKVPNARFALAQLSCNFYDNPSRKLQMVGITGTNGKTTVAHLIEHIMHEPDNHVGMMGTIEYRFADYYYRAQMTTPDAPFLNYLLSKMVQEKIKTAVMEVSSHALQQERTAGIDFDVAVFTNLTSDHLDYHKNLDDYLSAKTRLFSQLSESEHKNRAAVINADDPASSYILKHTKGRALTYAITAQGDITASDIRLTSDGTSFIATIFGQPVNIQIPLLGIHNVYNTLAAIGAAYTLGADFDQLRDKLYTFKGVPGRLNKIEAARNFSVYVDYAHTDDALKQVILTIKKVHEGRVIVLFGCGGDRDRTKRPLMGTTVCKYADYAIITSDNPRSENPLAIIEDIKKGFWKDNYCIEPDRKSAIKLGLDLCKKGDVLLVAGKGHEKYQIIGDVLYPFDDEQIIKEYLRGTESCAQAR